MGRLFVVPAKENSIIRYPKSNRILAAVGGYVPKNQYWTRRVADGDVLDCTGQKKREEVQLEIVIDVDATREVIEQEYKEDRNMMAKKVAKKKSGNKKT